jgi:hypothetical protein
MYVICDFLLLYWLAIYVFLLSVSLFVIEHSFYYLRSMVYVILSKYRQWM